VPRFDGADFAAGDLGSLLEFETLISELSSRFVRLPAEELDRAIEDSLRRICEPLGIDRGTLWQRSVVAPGVVAPTHDYYSAACPRPAEPLSQELFPWIAHRLEAGRTVVIPSVEALPPEAAVDLESARLRSIRSALCLPLTMDGERPLGALSFSSLRAPHEWTEALVNRLKLVAQVFGGALARRRADDALRASEARLEAGAELAGLGFYELDLGHRSIYVDDRFRDVCGIPPEPQHGLEAMQFWLEHLHPDDRPRVMVEREALLSGRVARLTLEYRYLHPTRGERWFNHVSRSVERDAGGRTVRTSGVVRDITARKLGESERRDLSQRLIRAHEEERALLARELHDDLTQRLAVLAIEVGRAELETPEPSQARLLRSVRQSLVRLSRDIHSLASQLHPSVLDELGLGEALRVESERLSRQGRIELSVEIAPLPAALDKDVALSLYRVAQGAMSNVVRHARARVLHVELRPVDGGLRLAVRDDGVGFDPAGPGARASLGLASMSERVRLVHGALEIESAPGRGTTVAAWVPAPVTQK
jgi:PAS domain S-box-containing protein